MDREKLIQLAWLLKAWQEQEDKAERNMQHSIWAQQVQWMVESQIKEREGREND